MKIIEMVLEALISPKKAEEHPAMMILVGAFYSTLALGISLMIMPTQASMMMVFFTVMACMPIVYGIIKLEESKDEKGYNENKLLKEHSKALKALTYLFIGMTISFSLWKIILPMISTTYAEFAFSAQTKAITAINGNLTLVAGAFLTIFVNNFYVLLYCTLFSFMYGLGAIYILTWNASVVGSAIGDLVSTGVAKVAQTTGVVDVSSYFKIYSCAYFVRYLPHGILEVFAYFTAGLAGGIMSVAIIRHNFGTKKFAKIVFDSSDLLLISIAILLVAAVVEVFVTPGIYTIVCK